MSILSKNSKKLYSLPDEVKFCKKCVMSNQRPRITFDKDGVCNACKYWESKENQKIDWSEREKLLVETLNKHRKTDGSYDVLVPSSGGKDSLYVAHILKYKYNMNPLTVTWAPNEYTDIGFHNFQSQMKAGLDNILITPSTIVNRKLTKISFEQRGDPFVPFVMGQVFSPMRIAVLYNIPLVFYGENGDVEYGGDQSTDAPFYKLEDQIVGDYILDFYPDQIKEYGISEKELYNYSPPKKEDVERVGVECHFWSYYKSWMPQSNYYYVVENTDFMPNPNGRSDCTYSTYASLDDKIDPFHHYLSLIKFGYARATGDAAHEIREGLISREEGVSLVRRFDAEFPSDEAYQFFLKYCDINEQFFWDVTDSWRSDHLWKKENGIWKLKYQVTN
jgi:N-acetyl sugar amidotransferase